MQPAAERVHAAIDAARASAAVSGNDNADMISALRKVARILEDPREPIALALRSELHAETGLSLPMIEWALVTSLSSLRHAPLEELVRALPAARTREVIGVVLAGNVFVAALRGIALPLLAGAQVIAKTASNESAFARAFRAALATAAPSLSPRLALVDFSRDDHVAASAFCRGVDALSIYGSDETVERLRALSSQGPAPRAKGDGGTGKARAAAPRIVPHGHGISAAYICRSQLQSREHALRAAERLALDIAAYDQHGCLSPHFVCVEQGSTVDPHQFAQLLAAEALPALAQLLPPSAATMHEQAAHLQWQATAAIRGELYAHDTHAVSFEEPPARPSPGGRRIGVYACSGHAGLRELLTPFAAHLKCIGVAGDKRERAAISYLLQRFCQASVCRSGEMQTPAFDAWADGVPPFAGLTSEVI